MTFKSFQQLVLLFITSPIIGLCGITIRRDGIINDCYVSDCVTQMTGGFCPSSLRLICSKITGVGIKLFYSSQSLSVFNSQAAGKTIYPAVMFSVHVHCWLHVRTGLKK